MFERVVLIAAICFMVWSNHQLTAIFFVVCYLVALVGSVLSGAITIKTKPKK